MPMNELFGTAISRNILRTRFKAVQLPMDYVRIRKHISQKSESWHDRSVSEIVGHDVNHGNRDGVAALCPLNVDRACQRMAEVQIDRRHVRCRRNQGNSQLSPSRVSSMNCCRALHGRLA